MPKPPKGYESWLEYCLDMGDVGVTNSERACAGAELIVLREENEKLKVKNSQYVRLLGKANAKLAEYAEQPFYPPEPEL